MSKSDNVGGFEEQSSRRRTVNIERREKMGLAIGMIGFLGFFVCVIWLLIRLIKRDSKKGPAIGLLVCFLLFMAGAMMMPKSDDDSTPVASKSDEPPSSSVSSTSNGSSQQEPTPTDLTGEWKQRNSNAEDSYHAAYISENVIEIYWVMESEDTIALYWAGSFEPPIDSKEPYKWSSENDTERTSGAMLASGDATKEFTYKDGELTYEASALGETMTVKLERGTWGYTSDLSQLGGSQAVESGAYTLPCGMNIQFWDNVRNDVTGNWRRAATSDSLVPADYALEYYNEMFSSDEEIHSIWNATLKTNTRIMLFGNLLFVDTLEYVEGEEHDAKKMFSGDVLDSKVINIETGEEVDFSD